MKSITEAIESTERLILHFHPEHGWSATVEEGADWRTLTWDKTAVDAVSTFVFGRPGKAKMSDTEREWVEAIQASRQRYTIEYWPSRKSVDEHGYLRGCRLTEGLRLQSTNT